jgi:hypothetical protein
MISYPLTLNVPVASLHPQCRVATKMEAPTLEYKRCVWSPTLLFTLSLEGRYFHDVGTTTIIESY